MTRRLSCHAQAGAAGARRDPVLAGISGKRLAEPANAGLLEGYSRALSDCALPVTESSWMAPIKSDIRMSLSSTLVSTQRFEPPADRDFSDLTFGH
jgi:hypothetical protein